MEYPPAAVKPILSRDQHRLYELIWNRFVASQMAAAEFEQTTIDILCEPADSPSGGYLFRATGSIPRFLGYLELYEEGNGPQTDPVGGNQEEEKDGENRITSYNVCYTKLLRSSLPSGLPWRRRSTQPRNSRITSYNVCYTKLLRSLSATGERNPSGRFSTSLWTSMPKGFGP